MRALATLKREASAASSARGHRLRWSLWRYPVAPFFGHGVGVCRRCGLEVSITERPALNGIDIGGEAVALNCKGGRQ